MQVSVTSPPVRHFPDWRAFECDRILSNPSTFVPGRKLSQQKLNESKSNPNVCFWQLCCKFTLKISLNMRQLKPICNERSPSNCGVRIRSRRWRRCRSTPSLASCRNRIHGRERRELFVFRGGGSGSEGVPMKAMNVKSHIGITLFNPLGTGWKKNTPRRGKKKQEPPTYR